jgi:hypothetical protein
MGEVNSAIGGFHDSEAVFNLNNIDPFDVQMKTYQNRKSRKLNILLKLL